MAICRDTGRASPPIVTQTSRISAIASEMRSTTCVESTEAIDVRARDETITPRTNSPLESGRIAL